ncbi:MAG: DNA modification methylase [Proteobacteria bacterium]|nr:DNA modification methylase [Pseudomonadota bacterium]
MLIKTIPLKKINPAPYNPRINLKPGDVEYEKLRQSINTFGYVEPLVWNERTGTLVSGHQRFKILQEQGLDDVEVSVVDLPIGKEKALNLALNKIRGSWDNDKLAELIIDIQSLPDFDVSLTGFDTVEISELLDNFNEVKDDDDFDFDAVVDSIERPITQLGDIINLGRHKIICGDSSNPEVLKQLIGDKKIQLLHTDPPYNVNYYGGNRPTDSSRPKNHKLWEQIYNDNMSQSEYESWLKTILTNISEYMDSGAIFYIWNGFRQFGPMSSMLDGLGFNVSCVITWAKQNFAIGYGDYNQQTEFCLYGWKKDNGAHRWYGPTNESTLWAISRDTTKNYIHPTQKPLAIPQRAIKNSSVREDLVLDLFLGSGSTLIASEAMNRTCYGVELDPRYCDGVVRRYINYVGINNISKELRDKYVVQEKDNGIREKTV